MPLATFSDHKETLNYLPKHHRTKGLTKDQVETFKSLEKRYVHEGRTIDPSFLEGPSIRQNFAAINFDCLLDIDEQICPRFILEFYATLSLFFDDDGEISLTFSTNQHPHFICLKDFATILGVPNVGTCLYTDKWPFLVLIPLSVFIHTTLLLQIRMKFVSISLLGPQRLGRIVREMR